MERMFRGRRGGVYGAAGLLVATWLLAGGSVSVRGETMPSPVAAGDSSVQITDGAKKEVSEKPFRVFELTSRRPDVAVFVGSVDYAKTTTIAFEASGRLAYVRAVGLPAKSEIFILVAERSAICSIPFVGRDGLKYGLQRERRIIVEFFHLKRFLCFFLKDAHDAPQNIFCVPHPIFGLCPKIFFLQAFNAVSYKVKNAGKRNHIGLEQKNVHRIIALSDALHPEAHEMIE